MSKTAIRMESTTENACDEVCRCYSTSRADIDIGSAHCSQLMITVTGKTEYLANNGGGVENLANHIMEVPHMTIINPADLHVV